MRRTLHLSAKQTAGLCVLGGLIASLGSLIEISANATSMHPQHSAPASLWAIAPFTTAVLGILLALYAHSSLENGIAAARWNDQEIESLRDILNSPLAKFLYIALLALMVASLILDFLSPHRSPAFWAIFILCQSFIWMRNATRHQTSNPNHEPTWNNLSPIRSDHWGQP